MIGGGQIDGVETGALTQLGAGLTERRSLKSLYRWGTEEITSIMESVAHRCFRKAISACAGRPETMASTIASCSVSTVCIFPGIGK